MSIRPGPSLRAIRVPVLFDRSGAFWLVLATATLMISARPIGAIALRSSQGLPTNVTTPSDNYAGAQTTTCSVTVNSVPPGGCYVQVGCDHPSLVSSPNGPWPYNLQYPNGGSATQTMNLTLSSVSV